MKRVVAGLAALLLALLCIGCAAPPRVEGAVNPTLFPREPLGAESKAPGRLALWLPPGVQGKVYTGLSAALGELQTGRIVEEALTAAVGDSLQGGVLRLSELRPVDPGFAGTMVIPEVRFEHDTKLLWLFPLPVFPFFIGDSDLYIHLAFDLSLQDAQGRTVWTRTYDGGRQRVRTSSFSKSEAWSPGLARMIHETAWRLSQQAVADLLQWLAAERSKPREL